MDFPQDISRYEILGLIGVGATSRVYLANCLDNNFTLAIKVINMEQCKVEIDVLHQEVTYWFHFQHPNVVTYYGSFVNGPRLYILMEFLEEGSVHELIHYSCHGGGFKSEEIISFILKNVLESLNYLHEKHHLHRDIKPGNILIGSDGRVKVGDFGVATSLIEYGRKRSRYTVAGTPCYMSPEVLQQTGHQEKADIWSFGITAIEMATGRAPYSDLNHLDMVVKIMKAPPPQLPACFSKEFRDLVRKCLIHSTERRPSASVLLKHPFFDKAKDSQFLVENLLKHLPPLKERFSTVKCSRSVDDFGQEVSVQTPQWHFCDYDERTNYTEEVTPCNELVLQKFEEEDKVEVIIKGRFRITKCRVSSVS
jgi:serine/threonine-protein kinase OSR1/STK39